MYVHGAVHARTRTRIMRARPGASVSCTRARRTTPYSLHWGSCTRARVREVKCHVPVPLELQWLYSGCTVAVRWLYGGCTVAVRLSLVRYPLSFNETALLAALIPGAQALSFEERAYLGGIWGHLGLYGVSGLCCSIRGISQEQGQKGSKRGQKGVKKGLLGGYPWCATP